MQKVLCFLVTLLTATIHNIAFANNYLFKNIEPKSRQNDEQKVILMKADHGILQHQTEVSKTLGARTKFRALISDGFTENVEDQYLSTTRQSRAFLYLSHQDKKKNTWTTTLTSLYTRQQINQFSNEIIPDRFGHRISLFSQSWKKEIYQNIFAHASIGIGRCERSGGKGVSFFTTGGARLQYDNKVLDSQIYAVQTSDNDSILTGIYGSDLRKEFGTKSSLKLTPRLKIHTDNRFVIAKSIFDQNLSVDRSPILVLQNSLNYQITDRITGIASYTYSKQLKDHTDLAIAQPNSSMFGFTISYSGF